MGVWLQRGKRIGRGSGLRSARERFFTISAYISKLKSLVLI